MYYKLYENLVTSHLWSLQCEVLREGRLSYLWLLGMSERQNFDSRYKIQWDILSLFYSSF